MNKIILCVMACSLLFFSCGGDGGGDSSGGGDSAPAATEDTADNGVSNFLVWNTGEWDQSKWK